VKKKVTVPDDPDPPKTPNVPVVPGGNTADKRLDELDRAAAEAKHPAIKKLLASYAVPFDRLSEKSETLRIRPIHLLWGKDDFPRNVEFPSRRSMEPAKRWNRARSPFRASKKSIHSKLVVSQKWMRGSSRKPVGTGPGPEDLTGDDQLAAAEKLLGAVFRFHEYARENGIRKTKSWDDVRKPLNDRLLEVRLKQLQRACRGADWQRARQFGTKLMIAYPKDATVAKEVAIARVAEAELLMKSNNHADRVKGAGTARRIRIAIPGRRRAIRFACAPRTHGRGRSLFDRAKTAKAMGNAVEARNDLDRAEALDPTIPGLREMKREIGSGYPVLYVGVRNFPERMSRPPLASIPRSTRSNCSSKVAGRSAGRQRRGARTAPGRRSPIPR